MEDKLEDCPICLEIMKDNIHLTQCLHKFHNTCFQDFLKNSIDHRCPICRTNLQQEENNEENDEWEDIFFNSQRRERHRRRMYNEFQNAQRRNEGRGYLDAFVNVFSDSNTISSITSGLRRTQQIEQSTESLINVIGPSAVRLFGSILSRN